MYSMKFCCQVCEYMTDIKANYAKHLTAQKHKLKIENSHAKCVDTKSISGALSSQPKVNLWSQPCFEFLCKLCCKMVVMLQ